MRWLLAAAVVLTSFLAACRGSSPPRAAESHRIVNPPASPSPSERAAWRANQADEVREVALRYALGEYGPYVQGKRWKKELLSDCTFFLSIAGKDPSDEFMQRFADGGPVMKKRSEWKSRLTRGQTDRFLGQTAGFDIWRLQWKTDGEVMAEVGAYLGQRERCWWKLVVVNRNGKWTVDRRLEFAVT